MASINDRMTASAAIQANALAGLRSARAQYPDTPILVFGCMAGSTGPSTGPLSATASEQAVQAAVAQAADPLTVFVPVSTDVAGPWVSGTGKIGTTTGIGNADRVVTNDGIHLGDEGCAMIGRRYADAAIRTLRSLYPATG